MTEYDYSPDAVERFQAKMAGVGRWASDQRYYAPKYSNPFIPEDQASSSPRPTPVSRQDSYARPSERSAPTRSRTLPANVTGASYGYGQTSRALAYAQQSDSSSPSRGHHRSGSQPPDPRRAYTTPAPVAYGAHHATPRASPVVYASHHQPAGAPQNFVEYKITPGQPIVLPPPRHGERFVIIPPKGGRVDIIPNPDSRSHSRSGSRGHGSRSGSKDGSSPTKKSGDPLFKRLFTGLTPNIEWGSDGSRSSSSRRESSRRRSASR